MRKLRHALRTFRLPMLIALSGVLSIALLLLVIADLKEQTGYNVYLDVIHEIQIHVVQAHHILEHIAAGDFSDMPENAVASVDRSVAFLEMFRTGGISPHDKKVVPLSDENLNYQVNELMVLLKTYRESAAQGLPGSAAGVSIDLLDRLMSRFLQKALLFDLELEKLHDRSAAHIKRRLKTVFFSWFIIMFFAAFVLVQREIRRRRDERQIAHAKVEWERTFDALSDMIMIIDGDYTVRRVNRSMADYLGVLPSTMIGKKCFHLVHGIMNPVEGCPHAALLKDWSEHSVDVFDEKRGRHLFVRVFPVFDTDGSLKGSVHVTRDVTEKKMTEEAMRIRDSAIGSSVTAFAMADVSGIVTYVNRAFLSLWRYASEKEIIGRPAKEFWREPRDAEEIMAALGRDGTWAGELAARRKDGTFFDAELSAHLVKDETGKPVCMMGSFSDITHRRAYEQALEEHKENLERMVQNRTLELSELNRRLLAEIREKQHIEASLRQSEGRYRQLSQEFTVILNAIPDSLILFSPELKIIWSNRAAHRKMGPDLLPLAGKYCHEVWHHEAEACAECPVSAAFRSSSPESTEITMSDGSLWAMRIYPIIGDDGLVNSVIQVATDITEKVSLQAERMRAMHLAALGELAAGVAHEINNPINGIINYGQLILNEANGDSGTSDIAKRIMKEGERIAMIVRSLLSFARNRREEKVPAYPDRILHDTIALTEAQMRKDNIDLRISMPPDLPPLLVNVQQIQQVFLNVVNNARYALNERFPGAGPDKVLEITAETVSVDGADCVRLSFLDHGPGIPAAVVDKVMNPFFTTKPAGIGTGLGLSISHGIITDHGGRMRIETAEGAFTRIVIELPIFRGTS